ncbi:RNA polymerase sigma factor, sigma-70 family [Herbaspirillum sp. CF444]|uniref:sigma-70 family RNA polymerase sigma factor n=1 Tax=Herbaspirillum sp. CF444 TaxID=1144319 RepID=UPI0002725E19|nr:sigma-70 family RNA polymerase sigma factor [Herbaspirillum sp. CF444]EJL82852.1 RNA polymerase sigma factor, sigma-70 family [Herbaspirillum sp. CF444]
MSNAEARQQIGVLYNEHHGWLATWLSHKLHCKNLGADLAQDTFLRILGARLPVDLREPRAYLATIAKGLLSNYLRRKKLEEAYLDALSAMPEPIQPSPEERLQVLETLAEIDRILDSLPAKAKQVFLLAQLDGLAYADICAILNLSLSTVKRHMVLAFRQCLAAL